MNKPVVIGIAIGALFACGVAYAVSTFNSIQVGTNPVAGSVLQTNGATSTWVATSTLGLGGGGGGSTTNVFGVSPIGVTQVGANATVTFSTTTAITFGATITFGSSTIFNSTSTFNSSTILGGTVSSTEVSALILAAANGTWGSYAGSAPCGASQSAASLSATGVITCMSVVTGVNGITGAAVIATTSPISGSVSGQTLTITCPTCAVTNADNLFSAGQTINGNVTSTNLVVSSTITVFASTTFRGSISSTIAVNKVIATDPTGLFVATSVVSSVNGNTGAITIAQFTTSSPTAANGVLYSANAAVNPVNSTSSFTFSGTDFKVGVTSTFSAAVSTTVSSALNLSNASGVLTAYGGASACSPAGNNFVTTVSAVGGTTCGTVTFPITTSTVLSNNQVVIATGAGTIGSFSGLTFTNGTGMLSAPTGTFSGTLSVGTTTVNSTTLLVVGTSTFTNFAGATGCASFGALGQLTTSTCSGSGSGTLTTSTPWATNGIAYNPSAGASALNSTGTFTFSATAGFMVGSLITSTFIGNISTTFNTSTFLGVNNLGIMVSQTTTKAIYDFAPSSTDDIVMMYTDTPFTLKEIDCVNDKVAGNTATFNITWGPLRNSTGSNAFTSATACTATSTILVMSINSSTAVAAGSIIRAHFTAASSTGIYIDFKY